MEPGRMSKAPFVSTRHLPSRERVRALLDEAHEACRGNRDGQNSDVYPALERVPPDLCGICLMGTSGEPYLAGDAEQGVAIMSVSKPFVFALVCQALGTEHAREKLGVNATGLPFNSAEAIDRSFDGRTNPMVNTGALGHDQPSAWRERRREVAQHAAVLARRECQGLGRRGLPWGF